MPKTTLEKAIEAHFGTILYLSSLGDPKEIVEVGPLKVSRDAPGRKRDPRREDFLIHNVEPAVAMRTIKDYKPRFWALTVVSPVGADLERLKNEYKAGGYRIITHFPFFAFDLTQKIHPSKSISVERVITKERAEQVKKMAGGSQISDELLHDGDAQNRLYAIFEKDRAIGMVRSIRTSKTTSWVSNLFVEKSHRKKGLGAALMQHMLLEDKKFGAKMSVLLATNEGSKLYRRVGYDEIGMMQIFTPIRAASQ